MAVKKVRVQLNEGEKDLYRVDLGSNATRDLTAAELLEALIAKGVLAPGDL